MTDSKRTLVAGHKGMVGAALLRRLQHDDATEVVVVDRSVLDLTRQMQVEEFLRDNRIDQVYIAAARVGGIGANVRYPADFLIENLLIEVNLIRGSHKAGIDRLLFLGSSCIYPRLAEQPIREEALLAGPLEPTNSAYAIAKIAGLKLCEAISQQYGRDYRSVMPTNLYGPDDNFSAEDGHVVPALLRRFHEAVVLEQEAVVVWGSGDPLREFMYVDDLAQACTFLMALSREQWQQATGLESNHLNVGTGVDCSISELVATIASVTGYSGKVIFDRTKPDGTPRKVLDVGRLGALGWNANVSLREGLQLTYDWFVAQLRNGRHIRGVAN